MPDSLRQTLLSIRDLLATVGPFVLLALALLVPAYYVLDPTPPKKVVLATGSEQGAYHAFGKRYQAILKTYGIQVELRNTQGAAENLALLRDPSSGVQLAFVQGGADEAPPAEADADDQAPGTPMPMKTSLRWCRSAACSSSRCGCSIGKMQRSAS